VGIEKAGSASKPYALHLLAPFGRETPRSARINTTRVTHALSTDAAAISRPIQQHNKRRVTRTPKRPKVAACAHNVEAK